MDYRGSRLEEMDLDAVLRRHPKVALIDELAHTNVPGSGRNEKRWQDVMEILAAGIDVITIELVDSSPEQLRRRMLHGNIYPEAKVSQAQGKPAQSPLRAARASSGLMSWAPAREGGLRTPLTGIT